MPVLRKESIRAIALSYFTLMAAEAQLDPQRSFPAIAGGSIRGTVRDVHNGAPVRGVQVEAISGDVKKEAFGDAQGRYEFQDLKAGRYRLVVRYWPAGRVPRVLATKEVSLSAGQDLKSMDFRVALPGRISGRVVNQQGEPEPGIAVFLVSRAYVLGALRHHYAMVRITDDRGEYHFNGVDPGRSYLILAQSKVSPVVEAYSAAPRSVKLRRRYIMPTYYPDSTIMAGAMPVLLQPGEHREGVEIVVSRTPSYCVEGILGSGGSSVQFTIKEREPTIGYWGETILVPPVPMGSTRADGAFRICDLHPGEYELAAFAGAAEAPGALATAVFTITDHDIGGFRLSPLPQVSVSGEVMLDPPAVGDRSGTVRILIRPMGRLGFRGERRRFDVQVPGRFVMDGLFVGEYFYEIAGLSSDLYVKDVLYGGESIRGRPLVPGSVIGNATLRIILGSDGGILRARVADEDNNPLSDYFVVVIPAGVISESALPEAALVGQTDQVGSWTSPAMAPGRYTVFAQAGPVHWTPEGAAELWRSRGRGKVVEIAPHSTVYLDSVPVVH